MIKLTSSFLLSCSVLNLSW